MDANHPEGLSQAAESLWRDLKPVSKSPLSIFKLEIEFPTIAIHMMITFYVTLLLIAILKGPNAHSPGLMSFVLIWHAMAIPCWFLKSLFERLWSNTFGALLFFLLIFFLIYLFHHQIGIGLLNIINWAGEADLASLMQR